MTSPNPGDLVFEAPGPGPWDQDPVHFPRPATRYWAETHPPAFVKGTSDFAEFYGLMIGGLQCQYVNRIGYNQILPPPEADIPRRMGRAEEVFANKVWREQLALWDNVAKPAAVAAHRAIQAVDADTLSDADLSAYLVRCRDHHSAMITQHMKFTASAVLPTGDFLAHAGAWTGLPPSELLGLLRGTATVSKGGSDEFESFVTAIAGDETARAILDAEAEGQETLDALRELPGATGAAVAGYLDLVGNRLLDGFDICEPRALELPDSLVQAMRAAVRGGAAPAGDVADRIATVRALVPPEHQALFDDVLGEARLMYRLRDERGVYSDIWASGLMRRAALAAGKRLAAAGRIGQPEDIVEASLDEMQALLAGGGPAGAELAARTADRLNRSAKSAPAALGEAMPPPDLSALPPAMGRLMAAMMISLGQVFGSSEAAHDDDTLRGLAASPGVYEGPARRISGPAEFGRIKQGDILVTEATTEAFNILLPLLGAIVTDNGGLLSHSAIVSREYGIPGVVGTRDATVRIADGARIRVDGTNGEVKVIA
ncbi:MAG: PEP-utilizing enzyme [Dehalococcoidia bacterium]